MVGFLTSSSFTRLYRGRAPRQSWETMTSVSAGHIILTPTQPVGTERPQRGSNPGPPHQGSRALPTELPRPPTGDGTKQFWGDEMTCRGKDVSLLVCVIRGNGWHSHHRTQGGEGVYGSSVGRARDSWSGYCGFDLRFLLVGSVQYNVTA